jgi:hypothetical protein
VKFAVIFILFSVGYAFTAVGFPAGLNIPLTVLVIMAMAVGDKQ